MVQHFCYVVALFVYGECAVPQHVCGWVRVNWRRVSCLLVFARLAYWSIDPVVDWLPVYQNADALYIV